MLPGVGGCCERRPGRRGRQPGGQDDRGATTRARATTAPTPFAPRRPADLSACWPPSFASARADLRCGGSQRSDPEHGLPVHRRSDRRQAERAHAAHGVRLDPGRSRSDRPGRSPARVTMVPHRIAQPGPCATETNDHRGERRDSAALTTASAARRSPAVSRLDDRFLSKDSSSRARVVDECDR
jgi:hypothetical protein